jgi:hypothetical protein
MSTRFSSLFRFFIISAAALLLLPAISGTAGAGDVLEIEPFPPLKNRPEGFAGLTWGDPSSKMGAESISMAEGGSSSETYVMPGGDIMWDDFSINNVNFLFTRDQLVMIRISFLDSIDVKALEKHVLDKFEKPSSKKNMNGGTVSLWEDEEIGVVLQLYKDKLPTLVMMNHKLAESLRD